MAKLLSRRCKVVLLVLARMLRLDISRLECRNAFLRRCIRARSQTNAEMIRRASADFVLMRQRVEEKAGWATAGGAPQQRRGRGRKPRQKRKCPGAGPQRAAVGRYLRGRKIADKAARKRILKEANAMYKAAMEAGGAAAEELRQAGEAGKESRAAGAHAFQGLAHKRQRRASTAAEDRSSSSASAAS